MREQATTSKFSTVGVVHPVNVVVAKNDFKDIRSVRRRMFDLVLRVFLSVFACVGSVSSHFTLNRRPKEFRPRVFCFIFSPVVFFFVKIWFCKFLEFLLQFCGFPALISILFLVNQPLNKKFLEE